MTEEYYAKMREGIENLSDMIYEDPNEFIVFDGHHSFLSFSAAIPDAGEIDHETHATVRANGVLGYYHGKTLVVIPDLEDPALHEVVERLPEVANETVEEKVARFHARAADHLQGCERHEHFLHHIDEKTGDEYDCLEFCSCPATN
jgi:hypothetical protein